MQFLIYTLFLNMDLKENRSENTFKSSMPENNNANGNDGGNKKNNKSLIIGIGAVLGVILLGAIVWGIIALVSDKENTTEETDKEAARELALEQQLAESELENADKDLIQFENQIDLNMSDTTQMRLRQQYESARAEIERLQAQLKDSKNKSAAEIARLRGEIDKLRDLLKHYLRQIAEMKKEIEDLHGQVDSLSTNLNHANEKNRRNEQQIENLSEENQRARKLNVSGISLMPLNKKGKREKNVTKARQFAVSFTINQNSVAEVGSKEVYVRLLSPEGNPVGSEGRFQFEGQSVLCSARKTFDYEGQECTLTLYVNVDSALSDGEYTVEIFIDGFRRTAKFNFKR